MEIPDRDKHEAEFAARIARLTGRYRKELLNDLGSGKNFGQIAGDFWLRVQGDLQSELAGILSGLFTRAAEANSGLIPSDLLGELEDDLLDAAREWSISRAVEVARDWVLNSISILTRRARDWLANPDAMVDDLARVFGAKRAARLAATELTLAQTAGIGGSGTGGIIDQGGKWGMAFERIWRSERDSRVCPICRRFHNTPEEAWGSVANGLVADDHLSQRMADRIIAQGGPPGHANCRCFLKVRGVDGRKMSDGNGGLYDVAEGWDASKHPRDAKGRFAQTDTPEFKAWFGDSKVVDAEGKPLRVFHGTPSGGFESFSKKHGGSNTQSMDASHGFSFTTDPQEASDYSRVSSWSHADRKPGIERPASAIIPVYLSVKNPMHSDKLPTVELIKKAKRLGHDGIIVTLNDGSKEITVFHPHQIKSATGNRGTFDPKSPNINEAFDPSQPRDANGRWSSDPLTDSMASEVIPAMRRIATGADRGELVSVRDLRKQFPTMPKETFDFMAATLSKAGILSLHRHDYVANLTDTERDELIHDPEADDYGHSGRDGLKGAYYIGANIRQ